VPVEQRVKRKLGFDGRIGTASSMSRAVRYISRPENQLMDVKIGSVTGSSLREHAELIVL
jgi:hypothetical protein